MNKVNTHIALCLNDIDLAACRKQMQSDTIGGECHFVGTVRNNKDGKDVKHLIFEAYEPMALAELEKIATRAKQQFDIQDLLIHHRIGKVLVGEIAVVIITVAAHRKATFDACRFAIDTLKETVPIWKKEVTTDGEVWISAHP